MSLPRAWALGRMAVKASSKATKGTSAIMVGAGEHEQVSKYVRRLKKNAEAAHRLHIVVIRELSSLVGVPT